MGVLFSLEQERIARDVRQGMELVEPAAGCNGCVRLPSLDNYDAGIADEVLDMVAFDPWLQRLRSRIDR